MRSLNVHVDGALAGTLHEGEDIWRFAYADAWRDSPEGFDLAPGLPRSQGEIVDGGTHRPVQWYFDNLLPEELLRQAISKEAGIKGDDAFALLEYLGAESAGSLTLLPPGQELPVASSLRELSDGALSERISRLPRQTLTAGAPKRMSLAGAQHKLLVVLQQDRLYEPVGATPSTHILKPAHPDLDSYPASVINEYMTMRLAGAAGLEVAAVHIRYVPQAVYIVDRFDRTVRMEGTREDGTPVLKVSRRHIIDACQLLNRSRSFKHTGASLEALRAIVEQTTNRAHTRLSLYRWLAFNVAMANDDCHLKNLSFFVSPEGVKLAPHYDLLATSAYYTRAFANENARWADVPMAIELPGARMFGEVTRDSLLRAAEVIGVPKATAERILAEVLQRLAGALQQELAALAERHSHVAEAARGQLGAEMRLVRVLETLVMREMLERLSR